jgi:hypothetical protein
MQALWLIWPKFHSTASLPTKGTREKEAQKAMARRQLTIKEQLKGIRAAIRSKRTPPQLQAGLRRRAEWLRDQIRQRRREK